MPSLENQQLKSLYHDEPCFVTFVNRTDLLVDLVWVNYNGCLVRYRSKVVPGERVSFNTYVTHPWIAWQSDTHLPLNLNQQRVYHPQPWAGERERRMIYLDVPMLPLLEFCLWKVRSLVRPCHYDELEIPRELICRLKERRELPVQDIPSR